MRIGYLMNTYPVTSATFIRREIAALEGQGVSITRFAVRRWDQSLVDPLDQREAERCTYLLAPGARRLGVGALREALRNPRGMARAMAGAWALWRNAGRGARLRHIAYLLEAVELKSRAAGLSHIHAHFSTNTAAVALLCARLGGPGYSFTAHGPDEFVDPGPSSLALKTREARAVVAITHYARIRLALAGGMAQWDKLHVIRCGVDPEALAPAPAPDPEAPLLCIGRLCPQKAQTLLIEAFARIKDSHPAAKLVLIGDGETRGAVEDAIRAQGLEACIELRGWADNAAVAEALAQARALVLPSFAEGLPIVIMEALARGRPVISTYIAGIPELVGPDCGWLVPAGDVEALAGTLRECLEASPKRRAAMGQAGRARVAQAHDLQANAAQLRALFESAS